MRIALCTNYISPYRLPTYRALASRPGWELTIYTSTDKGHDRDWDRYDTDTSIRVKRVYSLSYLANQTMASKDGQEHDFTERTERNIPLGLLIDLLRDRPDAIITGELGARTAIAKLAGLILGVPVIPWVYPSDAKPVVGPLRKRYRKLMIGSAPAVIGMGKSARRALLEMGAQQERIYDAENAADLDTIRATRQHSVFGRGLISLKHELGCDKKIALVIGRLVPMKAPELILEAWTQLPKTTRNQWQLVFVGDGPQRNQLESNTPEGVRFVGSVTPQRVSDYLAISDLHIFASLGDPWGLVVNEAMHHAKPTLCSTRAGCCADLIIDGITGFNFDPADGVNPFSLKLSQVLTRTDLHQVGQAALIHAASFTPVRMATGMARAVEHTLNMKAQGTCPETLPLNRKESA